MRNIDCCHVGLPGTKVEEVMVSAPLSVLDDFKADDVKNDDDDVKKGDDKMFLLCHPRFDDADREVNEDTYGVAMRKRFRMERG